MTYQEQIRRDKLRKKAAAAYYSFNNATRTGQRQRAIKQWSDANARLERLTDKTTEV
jgi:hypothetical protein